MTIKAIIWDLGGVILRTVNRTPREQLASRLGMTYNELSALIFDSESSRKATLGIIQTQDHWEAVRRALQLEEAEFPEVPTEFWGGDRLDTELLDYIRNLRQRFKIGLLSNAWDDLRQVLENKWGIFDVFDQVVISAEVGLAKPDPRIYYLILERLGVKPDEAIFIDDFSVNVDAAQEIGIHALRFTSPQQIRLDLEKLLDSKEQNRPERE